MREAQAREVAQRQQVARHCEERSDEAAHATLHVTLHVTVSCAALAYGYANVAPSGLCVFCGFSFRASFHPIIFYLIQFPVHLFSGRKIFRPYTFFDCYFVSLVSCPVFFSPFSFFALFLPWCCAQISL
jgi:hypothetical protein